MEVLCVSECYVQGDEGDGKGKNEGDARAMLAAACLMGRALRPDSILVVLLALFLLIISSDGCIS